MFLITNAELDECVLSAALRFPYKKKSHVQSNDLFGEMLPNDLLEYEHAVRSGRTVFGHRCEYVLTELPRFNPHCSVLPQEKGKG